MRIAHLSDFHMRHHLPCPVKGPNLRNWEIPRLLEPVLAQLRLDPPDLLVVSGDVIDYPLDALDDPERQAQGVADLSLLREILETARCPISIVPGNHDHPFLFDQVFGDLPQDFECAGHRVLAFFDAEDADHVPHRTGADRARFVAALDTSNTQSPALPQIHIQHFLIWPPLQESYPYNYPDSQEMLDAMAESGRVRLCLNGHFHGGGGPTQVQGIIFANVPAFCEPPHPCWIYQIDESGVALTTRLEA